VRCGLVEPGGWRVEGESRIWSMTSMSWRETDGRMLGFLPECSDLGELVG